MVYYVGGRGKSGNILEQKQYNMLEMVQFEYPRLPGPGTKPLCLIHFW